MSNSKNTAKRRPWPEKRRKAQAERIRRTKPWERTTGPKSPDGKARSSANARKIGLHTAELRKLRTLLRAHAKFLKDIMGKAKRKENFSYCHPERSEGSHITKGDPSVAPLLQDDSEMNCHGADVPRNNTPLDKRGTLRKRRSTTASKHGGVDVE